VEGLAATSADARDDRPPPTPRLRRASPSRRFTGRSLFDNRRGEASSVEHSHGAHALLPVDIFSSTVQLGARGEIGEDSWSPVSALSPVRKCVRGERPSAREIPTRAECTHVATVRVRARPVRSRISLPVPMV
jgi:hypothetical protein